MGYFTALLFLVGYQSTAWSQEASQQLRQSQAQEQDAMEGQYGARAAPLQQSYSKAYQNYLQKKGPYPQAELKKINELKVSREKARAELSQKHQRERVDLREKTKAKSLGSAARATGKKSNQESFDTAPTPPAQALDATAFPKMIEFKKKGTK